MRISDWSSDVCSSDLDLGKKARPLLFDSIPDPGIDAGRDRHFLAACKTRERCLDERVGTDIGACRKHRIVQPLRGEAFGSEDRTSVVQGTSGQERLDLGGRSIIKKKMKKITSE